MPASTVASSPLPQPLFLPLPGLTDNLADHATHWHKLKLDGNYAQVALGTGGPRVFKRAGHDWTDRFADLLPALRDIPCASALIDGEIVGDDSLDGFGTRQDAITAGGPFRHGAFDLLRLDGRDLTARNLTKRRAALETLLRRVPPMGAVALSPVIHGHADDALALICGKGREGMIAKQTDVPYRGGRSRDRLTIKSRRQGTFQIMGGQASTSRGRPFASLALACERDGALVYMGKVGIGFDQAALADLARRTAPLTHNDAPVKATRRKVAGVT